MLPRGCLRSDGAWAGSAFEVDDGASLHMAVKSMREETITQGMLHESVAKELSTNVVEPFEKWATDHKVCSIPHLCLSMV